MRPEGIRDALHTDVIEVGVLRGRWEDIVKQRVADLHYRRGPWQSRTTPKRVVNRGEATGHGNDVAGGGGVVGVVVNTTLKSVPNSIVSTFACP